MTSPCFKQQFLYPPAGGGVPSAVVVTLLFRQGAAAPLCAGARPQQAVFAGVKWTPAIRLWARVTRQRLLIMFFLYEMEQLSMEFGF